MTADNGGRRRVSGDACQRSGCVGNSCPHPGHRVAMLNACLPQAGHTRSVLAILGEDVAGGAGGPDGWPAARSPGQPAPGLRLTNLVNLATLHHVRPSASPPWRRT